MKRLNMFWASIGVFLLATAGSVQAGYVSLDRGEYVIAHAFYPPLNGVSASGDIHFFPGVQWVDEEFDLTGDPDIDFFTVALHELGHSLGLKHSNIAGSVMEAFYAGGRRTLHASDVNAIRTIYGGAIIDGPGVGPTDGRKWGNAAFGTPGAVSFSVMPAGSFLGDDGRPAGIFANLYAGNELGNVLGAFAVWAAATNLTNLGVVADNGAAWNAEPVDPRQLNGPFGDIRLATFTPEPNTLALAGSGVIGLLAFGWRRRRKAA